MTLPLPPDNDSAHDDLPLRHRASRAIEAEKIRQEFVRSQKRLIFEGEESSAKEMPRDEQ